jgi:hypothetical protein
MRFIFFSVLVAMLISAEQQPIPRATPASADDSYSVSQVSSAIQFLKGNKSGVVSSFTIKEYLWPLLPLGDRVSIAILKIYTPDELVQSDNAEAYLTVVRNAFSMRTTAWDYLRGSKIHLHTLTVLMSKTVVIEGSAIRSGSF